MKKEDFIQQIINMKGQPYWVGGCVRDPLLGYKAKDKDLIIFNLSAMNLEHILSSLGRWKKYGKSQLIWAPSELKVEITLSSASLQQDAYRRDFTMNAIYQEVITGKIVDPIGGIRDIKSKQIKMTGPEAFRQDPLRVYRAIQLASRFDLSIESKTLQMMRKEKAAHIASERIYAEMQKWIMSPFPQIGFEYMVKTEKCLSFIKGEQEDEIKKKIEKAIFFRDKSKNPELFMWALLICYAYQSVFSNTEKTLGETDFRSIREAFYQMSRHHEKSNALMKRLSAIKRLLNYENAADCRRISLLLDKEETLLFAKALERIDLEKMIHQHWPAQEITPYFTGNRLKEMGIQEGTEIGKWHQIAFELQLEGLEIKKIEEYINRHIELR